MSEFSYDFDPASHFTVGAIGVPGDRTFFLQAGRGIEFVSMISEKEQMRALSEGILSLLDQIADAFGRPTDDAPSAPMDAIEPILPVWRIAQLGVGYDDEHDRIIVIVQEMSEEEEPDPEVGRFTITREQARAFAHHTLSVVDAGRPICPFCGQPIDPAGHFCPGSNGHGKSYVQ